jgi:hypothetical protein
MQTPCGKARGRGGDAVAVHDVSQHPPTTLERTAKRSQTLRSLENCFLPASSLAVLATHYAQTPGFGKTVPNVRTTFELAYSQAGRASPR